MSKAGLFAGLVAENPPADGAATLKQKGYQWMHWGVHIPDTAFILLFNIPVAGDLISLPLYQNSTDSYQFDFTVDWGDGVTDHITAHDQAERTHQYTKAGHHLVIIIGKLEAWSYQSTSTTELVAKLAIELDGGVPAPSITLHPELLQIRQWGDVGFKYIDGAFAGCNNLNIRALDRPNLTQVTSLGGMFYEGEVSGNFSNWDTSTITNMAAMFYNNENFNEDIDHWDVSNVEYFFNQFSKCRKFNRNLAAWDMGAAINATSMFWSADSYEGNGLRDWDVSNLRYMKWMFVQAGVFNGDLSQWEVGNVIDTNHAFAHTPLFNSDLSQWDTGSLIDMEYMFTSAKAFNSDVSGWNTENVTKMEGAFHSALLFNSDLSSWNVSNVTDLAGFLSLASSFSRINYDRLLNGWSSRPVQPNITISIDQQYTIAISQAGRDILTNAPNHWGIHDLGGV